MLRRVLTAALLILAPALNAARAGDDPKTDESARATAVKLLDAGAKMFDTRDAKGLADTYTDDATLTYISQDANSRTFETSVKQGRAEIEALYRDTLKPDSTFHAKNHVEYARWLGSDLLMIAGKFVPDTESANPLKIPFVQVRKKQGDTWRIFTIQVFIIPEK